MTLGELRQKITHDCADENLRSPIGAVPAGESLTLAFSDASGEVLDAELLLYCDDWEKTYEACCDGDRWYCDLAAPEYPAALWYCFHLHLAEGDLWLCAEGRFGVLLSDRGEGFRLTVYERGFSTPAWFRRSVMYQIFPDRFSRDGSDAAARGLEYHLSLGRQMSRHQGWDEPVDWQPNSADGFYFPSDFYGGTLRGIEERLPYLRDLGVGVIYLNPIFEACSNHRYDAADYLRIDPILGTEEDFSRLCESARGMGVRIMLDGVFSHTGADSVYFNKFSRYPANGAYNSADSEYFPWYDFRSFPDDYRCWWNFSDLPEVDEENPAWQDYVITGRDSVVKHWLRQGASGWRLDVADELPDDVLRLIRLAAREADPDAVVLGEVWEDAVTKTSYGKRRDYALGMSLDSVMNYPLREALLDFFTFRSDARALCGLMLSQRLNYPAPLYYSLMNLLGSHDTERIRTYLASRLDARSLSREQQADFVISDAQDARGEAMQRLCSALQFTLPGVPCIYYGDEAGMSGMRDPFCRGPFRQGTRPLTDWYSALARIRRENPALSTGSAAFFAPDGDVLCLLRAVSGGKDLFGESAEDGAFLICVNRSGERRRAVADLWLRNAGLTAAELERLTALELTGGVCLLGGGELRISRGLAALDLPPQCVRIYKLG